MVVSREKNLYKAIAHKKVALGMFFTEKNVWLTDAVSKFIEHAISTGIQLALDPFAGEGHLLESMSEQYKIKTKGLDINGFAGNFNDSLILIPPEPNSIIITNPPYLTNYSAKRKGVLQGLERYFVTHEDLYQLALANCLCAARYIVALIPETFIWSNFDKRNVVLVNVLITNPFSDTENPICVVCCDTKKTSYDFDLYVDNSFALTYVQMCQFRQMPATTLEVKFNDPNGPIGLKAVDGVNKGDYIKFTLSEDLNYAPAKIKHSSRLLTYLSIPELAADEIEAIVKIANQKLSSLRVATSDLALSPFKGNNKNGQRRRRLDYRLAKKILAESYFELKAGTSSKQMSLI